jgi:tetratricopeptide (TPR) repeat protein
MARNPISGARTAGVLNDAAPSMQLKLVWAADGSDVPAVLEPGAAPHLVAFHRAHMRARAGQIEQALELFREVVRLEPEFALGHLNVGWSLMQTGQLPEAIRIFREITEISPDFAPAYRYLGWTLDAAGCREDAIAVYDDQLARFGAATELPEREEVAMSLMNKADTLRALGRAEDELALYDDLIARFGAATEPPLREWVGKALSNKGTIFLKSGQFQGAIAALREAAEILPDTPVYTNLGAALTKAGHYADAISALRKAVEIGPSDTDALFHLGIACAELRQFSDAIAAFRQVADMRPDHPEVYAHLGHALASTFQLRDAIVAFRKAIKIKPDDAISYANLGRALADIGQFSRAISAFRKALTIEPDDKAQLKTLPQEIMLQIDAYIKNIEENNSVNSKKYKHNVSMDRGNTLSVRARGSPEFRHALHPLPKGLSWPRDDYDQAPEFNAWHGLPRYLERVWKDLIPFIDMPTLREHWPRLGEAIDRQRKKLPPELLPPVKKELTDRKAAAFPNPRERPAHVDWALRNRVFRARQKDRIP